MDNEELQILIQQIRDELKEQILLNRKIVLQLWDEVHGTNLFPTWEKGNGTEDDLSKEMNENSLVARIIQLEEQNKSLKNKLRWALRED